MLPPGRVLHITRDQVKGGGSWTVLCTVAVFVRYHCYLSRKQPAASVWRKWPRPHLTRSSSPPGCSPTTCPTISTRCSALLSQIYNCFLAGLRFLRPASPHPADEDVRTAADGITAPALLVVSTVNALNALCPLLPAQTILLLAKL